MKKLLSLITGGLIKDVGSVIDNLTTTDEERLEAKKIKDFIRADQIRQDLLDMDIEIKDSQEGTEWSVKQ